MKKFLKSKKSKIILISIIGASIFILLSSRYPQKEVPTGGFTSGQCEKASFEINSINCENNLFEIELENTGGIDLDGSFLTIISTDKMQALIANDTEHPLDMGDSAILFIHGRKLAGTISRIEVGFQPCPFAVAVKENLAMACD